MNCLPSRALVRHWLSLCLIAALLLLSLPPATAQDDPPPIGLALYRSEQFSVPYPNFWEVTERGIDVYFGAGRTPVCSEAGMIAAALGAVGNRTFEDLLSEYTRTFIRVDLSPERVAIRRNGLSASFIAPCTDGTPRQYRVTFFIAYGQAYRLAQFAPQAAFSAWADVYGQIVNEFSPTTVGGGENGSAIELPNVSPLALIAHLFGGNVYVGTLADLPGKAITQGAANGRSYRYPTLSPNGSLIAFTDPTQRTLWLSATANGATQQIADDVAEGYPLAWSADGSLLAYMAQQEDRLQLRAVQLPDLSLRDLGETLAALADCPTLSNDPADRLYWAETGAEGNAALMAWAGDALYYSLHCGVGIAQLREGKSTLINAEVRRAQLSPDGKALLGVLTADGAPQLVRLNLQTGALERIQTPLPADQVAWRADGSGFFYATATLKEEATISEGDAARGLALFGAFPLRLAVYEVQLWEVDLRTGIIVSHFSGEGRAIGRIAPSPDGSGVLFSVVQSAKRLVDAFVNNVSSGELRREAPVTQLYWRTLPATEDERALLIAISSAPTWGKLGSAAAPTPTSSPRRPGERPSATPTRTATPSATPTLPPTLTPSPTAGERRTAPPTNTPRPTATP